MPRYKLHPVICEIRMVDLLIGSECDQYICNKACENWDPKLPIKRVMLVFIYLAVGQKGIVFIYLLSMNINYQYLMPVEFMIKINITCGYFHLLIRSQILFFSSPKSIFAFVGMGESKLISF